MRKISLKMVMDMPNNEQEIIGLMFDRIAKSYDMLNRILSFRQDVRWRRIVSRAIAYEGERTLLDVATGTGDLLITICEDHPNIIQAHGIDIATNMLAIAEKKIRTYSWQSRVSLQRADVTALPFADQSFDVITTSFGIRNVVNIREALTEMARVLKNDGMLIILEFSLPKNWLVRMGYLFYFRYVLPCIGGIFSGDFSAYRYLNRTVEEFFPVEALSAMLKQHGYSRVEISSLSGGIATIYGARKA